VPLDPALDLVVTQLNSAGGPKLHDLTATQARALYEAAKFPGVEVEIPHVEDRVVPGAGGGIPVRIYRPEGSAPQPALVYFHGGGWVIGSIETHDGSCRELAKGSGCTVVSVDYRLAPEHRYPAAADDCYAALSWVAENAGDLKIDPERIAVGGDSAGGNLATVVSMMARDRNGPLPRFQLLVYPITDADFESASYRENAEGYLLERATMQWFWDHYIPGKEKRSDAYAAPLRAPSLEGLPPALVITAEFDPLRDEGEAYAGRLKRAGVPTTLSRYDGMIHGFIAMSALVGGARDAVGEAVAALRDALA
jgi:acetyl esterase